LATEQPTSSILNNVAAGLDHFDPFQGFVDDGTTLNIRYGFRLGKANFLVNKFSMSEVVTKPIIYPIPNTPSWIQGLINLRGILVPVFNIKKRIGQNNEDDSRSNILLVIDKGERAFATYIDALPDSINIDEVELTEIQIPDNIPDILKGYVSDAYKLNEDVWLELNYDAFIKNMTKDYSDLESDKTIE
jgi:chemotaxis signal transduction protein